MTVKTKFVGVRFTEEEVERLQSVAPNGNVSGYIRDTVLGLSKNDGRIANLTDYVVDLNQHMKVVTDLLNDLEKKVSSKPTAPGATGSQEPGGIPEELVGMVLETLLLVRSFSSPQDRKIAQADVAQIGLPTWSKA